MMRKPYWHITLYITAVGTRQSKQGRPTAIASIVIVNITVHAHLILQL